MSSGSASLIRSHVLWATRSLHRRWLPSYVYTTDVDTGKRIHEPRTRYDKRIAARREKGYREPRDRLVDQALGKAPRREPSWRQHLEGINEDNARAVHRRAYRICRIGPRCSRFGPGQDRQDRRAE